MLRSATQGVADNSCFSPPCSGELTLEEFIEGAKGHHDIMDMLKNLMDLTPVLSIIVEARIAKTKK